MIEAASFIYFYMEMDFSFWQSFWITFCVSCVCAIIFKVLKIIIEDAEI